MLDDEVGDLGFLLLAQVGVRHPHVAEARVAADGRQLVSEEYAVLGAVLVEGRVGVPEGVSAKKGSARQ